MAHETNEPMSGTFDPKGGLRGTGLIVPAPAEDDGMIEDLAQHLAYHASVGYCECRGIVAMDCVDDLSSADVKMTCELRGGCLIAIAQHVDGRRADYRMSLDTLEMSESEYAARDLFEQARSAL